MGSLDAVPVSAPASAAPEETPAREDPLPLAMKPPRAFYPSVAAGGGTQLGRQGGCCPPAACARLPGEQGTACLGSAQE